MREAASGEGRTVLYVSHNMNTIRQLCDRCIVLDKGQIIFDGDVENAINIYMDSRGNLEQVFRDLSQISTKAEIQSLKAKIMSIELINRNKALYIPGERINLEICVEGRKLVKQLQLRIELRYADDSPVATIPEILLGKLEKDKLEKYRIDIGTDLLTKGKYRMDLVLFEKDPSGNSIDYDLVLSAIYFEIQGDESIEWNTQTWGHIKLSDVNVKR